MDVGFMRKAAALFTGVVFLYSTVAAPLAEANFWRERRDAARHARASPDLNGVLPAVSRSIPGFRRPEALPAADVSSIRSAEGVPAWLASLPSAYGDIQNVRLVPRARAR